MLASKQYEEGHYTQREGVVMATTFSTVSITFSLVVLAQVGLEHMFLQFYAVVCAAGFVAAVITPRIPLLELLQVPEAANASETLVVGFAEMFVPSILAAPIETEMTRFIIAAVSVTQLIYYMR